MPLLSRNGEDMPVAIKQQVQNSNMVPPKKHKSYKRALVIGAGLALIIVIPFLIFWGGVAIDTAGMGKYLQDKYGQEFKVKYLEDKGVSIGDPGQRVGTAHPANDNNLTFEVGRSRNTGVYFDTYTATIWAHEGRPEAEAFLKTVYQPVPDFDVDAGISSLEDNPVRGNVPSLGDAIKKYNNKFIYGVNLRLNVPQSLGPDDKQEVISKLNKVAQFILSKHVAHPSLGITMWIGSTDQGYGCSLYDKDFSDINGKLEKCFAREKTLKQPNDRSN